MTRKHKASVWRKGCSLRAEKSGEERAVGVEGRRREGSREGEQEEGEARRMDRRGEDGEHWPLPKT